MTQLIEKLQYALLILFDLVQCTILDLLHRFMHLTVLARQERQNRQTMVDLVQLLRRRLRLWTLDSIRQQRLQGGVSFGFGGQIYNDGRRRLEADKRHST